MSPGNADRNLLLGILAYQNAFITKEQLLAGMQAWLYDKTKSLGEILRGQGALDERRLALLDALVDQHVIQHGGDPRLSLQAVRSAGAGRKALKQLPGIGGRLSEKIETLVRTGDIATLKEEDDKMVVAV